MWTDAGYANLIARLFITFFAKHMLLQHRRAGYFVTIVKVA